MGGCQNCGPFLGTLNIRCRINIGIQKGTIIFRTSHVYSLIFFPGQRGTGLSDRHIHLLIANFLVRDDYLAEKGSIFHICLWRGQKQEV